MKTNHPIARQSLIGALLPAIEDRGVARQHGAIQRAAFLARAEDVAHCELAKGRMTDFGDATQHGIAEGAEVVDNLMARIQNNPANQALAGIAQEGLDGMRDELRYLRRRAR